MANVHPLFPIERTLLEDFCRHWRVAELSLFGSAARGEAHLESDYDVMVEFQNDSGVGLWQFTRMQDELAEMVGRPVDLVEKGTIRNPFRSASIARDLLVVFRAA